MYGNKKQFESFQKSTSHMKSIDLSNVNKTTVSLNRSRSLKQKFQSKFGNDSERTEGELLPPPKSLGVNSITVNIGDFKAQKEADKL